MFRDDLRASVQEFRAYQVHPTMRGRLVARLGRSGERPPYTALVIGCAMLGVYAFSSTPASLQTAEILREGSSPMHAWVQPSTDDLLAGHACIPIERLLENRPMGVEHSYSRPVVCPKVSA